MDHEKLLAKYIQYIGEMEGTDYLGFDHAPAPFTEAEWDELQRLAIENKRPVIGMGKDAWARLRRRAAEVGGD